KEALQRRSLRPRLGRQGVVGPPVGIGDLDEAELADIARERGLRHVHAVLREPFAQLFLAVDAMLLDELEDDGVSLAFVRWARQSPGRARGVKPARACPPRAAAAGARRRALRLPGSPSGRDVHEAEERAVKEVRDDQRGRREGAEAPAE